ncbi:unnamed protein product [Caenorhabditis brenneri]
MSAKHAKRGNYESSDDEDEEDSTRKWCFCDDVSHGQMIRCDNRDCTLRWFHFPCIGITEAPKGKWICPRCDVTKKLNAKRTK